MTHHHSSTRGRTISLLWAKATTAVHSFDKKEFATFIALSIVALISSIWLLGIANSYLSTQVPVYGGTLREGIAGAPRFVNPVLAATDADKDVTALVFSGLMRVGDNAAIIPDLAESYTISPDGKMYTFTLKNGVTFQDGTAVTADDIVYTITQIQNPLLDSPKRASWQGVDVLKIDERTVQFTLKQAFSPFLLLTTVGILPSHLWKNLTPEEFSFSELNTNAIGSGPYTVSSVSRNTSGIPKTFILHAFKKFALGKPFIKTIEIETYANERELADAIQNGNVDEASGFSPERAKEITDTSLVSSTTSLPRIFALFMNESANPIFSDSSVVHAVENGINKDALIEKILYGYGEKINGPVPRVFLPDATDAVTESGAPTRDDIAANLDAAGWKIGANGVREKINGKTTQRLSFSIATADTPELTAAAEEIKNNLSLLGFDIKVQVYSLGDLNQDIIRPRAYESLFFGQYVTSVGSLYAFWESSEVADPGLNVGLLKDSSVDKLLSDILSTPPSSLDLGMYQKLTDTIRQKSNVAFVYSPLYISFHKKNVHTELPQHIVSPADRFGNVFKWYIETDNVWKIFTK